ncbi:hypothetical protein D3C75_618490 [compost metagenome]
MTANWKPFGSIGPAPSGHNEAEVITMANTKPLVKCSVSNCHYWGEQNLCHAEQIVIEIDKHSGSAFKEEYAEEMTTTGMIPVWTVISGKKLFCVRGASIFPAGTKRTVRNMPLKSARSPLMCTEQLSVGQKITRKQGQALKAAPLVMSG